MTTTHKCGLRGLIMHSSASCSDNSAFFRYICLAVSFFSFLISPSCRYLSKFCFASFFLFASIKKSLPNFLEMLKIPDFYYPSFKPPHNTAQFHIKLHYFLKLPAQHWILLH